MTGFSNRILCLLLFHSCEEFNEKYFLSVIFGHMNNEYSSYLACNNPLYQEKKND